MLLNKIIARRQKAQTRLFSYVALQPQHADICILVYELFYARKDAGVTYLFVAEATWGVIGSQKQPESISTDLARQLRRVIGINYCARVHGGNRRLKNVYAFEEEGTLLGEEYGEALVGGDDGLVGFDLRE